MIDDLVSWLRLQLDDDERIALAASQGEWRWIDPGGKVKQALVTDGFPWQMVLPSAWGDVYPQAGDAEHIATHDPARVLREVEAKRRLLDEYEVEVSRGPARPVVESEARHGGIVDAYLVAVRLLAAVYQDRPGFREDWRVT